MRKRSLAVYCLSYVSGLALGTPVHAQTASTKTSVTVKSTAPTTDTTSQGTASANEDGGLQDIIVTAERRASSVQRTPIAISAISGDALTASGISTIEGLTQRVPNLTFSRGDSDAKVTIRGLGMNGFSSGGEPRVAFYLDGAYQPRTQSALFGFYDIDRLEVLRGPQGTLYGRNAIAGTINVITRDADDSLDGYFTGTVGNYRLVGTEGAVGGPLTDGVDARVAFRTVDRGGYGKNIVTGEDANDEHSRNVRGKLKFEPTSNLVVRLTADYTNVDDHSSGYFYVGGGAGDHVPLGEILGSAPADPQDTASPRFKTNIENYGFLGQIDWSIGPDTKLVSLSAYRKFDSLVVSSVDVTTAQLSQIYTTESSASFSQELRLQQSIGSIADLILGGYYFHEKNSALTELPFKGAALTGIYSPFPPEFTAGLDRQAYYEFYGAFGLQRTSAYAAFGQANIHLADRLELDVGARYSHERKSIFEQAQVNITDLFVLGNALDTAPPFGGEKRQSVKYSSFDPKATLSFRATDRIFVYATYSRGFKAGGFNLGGLQDPFKPEKLTNYEVGVKADFLDRRLRVNLAGFNYDYKQLQLNIVEPPADVVTRNASSATVRGVEVEIKAIPIEGLTIGLNGSYLDAKFGDFIDTDPVFPERGPQDLTGNRLPTAPRWKIDGDIGYTFETRWGRVTPSINVGWVDKIYFSQFNTRQLSQPARTQIDLLLNFDSTDTKWSAAAWVKNLTNDTYVIDAQAGTSYLGDPIEGRYGPPLTVGFSVTRRF